MNGVLKIFVSMSFSGGLLILALLLGKRFLKNRVSRQWQYYIWLVVIFRLLLPFGPETSLLGKIYQVIDQSVIQAVPLQQPKAPLHTSGDGFFTTGDLEYDDESANSPAEDLTSAHRLQDIVSLMINYIWLIWLVAALGMLIRKVTIYQGFIRYINADLTPVSDIEILDRLSVAAEQAGIKKPIELCVNPLVSSPLLIGFFHPCIVLPSTDISEKDFCYIFLHELTHYKRRDMFYKWLVQATVCLHWFNPLVHLMSREITKACEFSCDEAVLAEMGSDNAQDYGKTLLDAMAAIGKCKENPGAVSLSENKQLLKERIHAIMNFKKMSMAMRLLMGMLTLCVILGAAFVGVYPTAAASAASKQPSSKPPVSGNSNPIQGRTSTHSRDYAALVERYYEADSLPLFEIAFSRLDESKQKAWLEKLYSDDDFAFFSAAVRGLDTNSSLLADFSEKAYIDEEITFFSTLTDCMDETELDSWLDRALKDGKWDFQSMLFDKLDRDDELEEKREKKLAEAQVAEYQAAGVTIDGKNYYYKGQLVNIFLDIRANKSYYTLDTNPAGTVNINIIRDVNNKITGVAYITEAEVAELLGTNKASSQTAAPDEQLKTTSVSSENEFDWDWDDEKDKEWDKARRAEYHAVGVTVDGKNYYYKEKLVNIFLDIRANKSFYALDINPAGTVNIKIIRDANNKITSVAYMTEAEVTELLDDMA